MTSSLPNLHNTKILNISGTRWDMTKRKTPFFFTFKDLSNSPIFQYLNFSLSVNDVATASMLQQEMTSLLAGGGFRLTKWSSSSREVLPRIRHRRELACPTLTLLMERTLGMKWNTDSDCLCFSVRPGQPVLTKRGVLSRVSSVFDPLRSAFPLLVPCQFLNSNIMEEKKALSGQRACPPSKNSNYLVGQTWINPQTLSDALVQRHLVYSPA